MSPVRTLAFLALCSISFAADLDDRVHQADGRAARRLASLALRAQKDKQVATARRAFERVLVLDSENRIARGKLGFKKKSGEWVRASGAAIEIDAWVDTDPDRAARFRAESRKLELTRANDVLKQIERWGTPETARPHLLSLLDVLPRMEPVHVALGHEKVGDVYVRHELADFVRAMPQRMAKWQACRTPGVAELTGESIKFPGVDKPSALARIGEREVAAASTPEQSKAFAAQTECAQKFVRLLLGDGVNVWNPSCVYFLTAVQYRDFIYDRHADEQSRKQRVKYAVYRSKDCVAVRMASFELALDLYAHNVGFFTASRTASPKKADGKRDTTRYAWCREGLGLLLSLELLDSAECWFSSESESSGKAQPTLPVPTTRTRKSCLAYLRGQMLDGVLPPMREIFGNSLNNLDRVRALQAWSFLRFLALYDPAGFKRLPPALQEQASGAQADRAVRALEKAFAKPASELERLWRIYLLELS